MFSLTIVFGPGPMVWTLMFKNQEAALGAADTISKAPLEEVVAIHDEFGQACEIGKCNIYGFMVENLEQSKLAHIERALHQARTKVKADELAQADPVIRSAATRQGGAILQPAMPGMPFQNGRMPS
jgi:hypothetical protein